jgi:hypothetical protein
VSNLPLVSIITPSFNAEGFLEDAIQSVVSQDYPHLEHIIIDGASTDSTLDILGRYGPPVTWLSEPDQGQADALNKGFRRAKGDIIGWLNADDTYQPDVIRSAITFMQAHPEVDLVYGNFNFIDGYNQVIKRHSTVPFALEKFLYGDAIIPQTSMFFRKRVLAQSGGVNPDLHYTMDWEFTFRLARTYQVKRVNETWGNFRIVEGTKSVQHTERFWPEMIKIVRQISQDYPQIFQPVIDDALFMNHLRAALEFARVGQGDNACRYLDQAFQNCPQPRQHPAVLASALFKTATYPWHSAFQVHPQAEQALDNVCIYLDDTPLKQQIQGFLNLYQALRQIRQGHLEKTHHYLSQALHLLRHRDFFHWRSARMMLGAILK